jgi:Tfp pilus assembly protein PilF
MTISSIKPKSAVFFATGDTRYIKAADRQRLTVALRADASDNRIHEELRLLNEAVSDQAKRAGTNTVGPGCYTASLYATGKGSTHPFLTDEQSDFIPPEFALMMKRLGVHFNRKIGPDGKPMPIRLVQSASGRTGASPEYFREQLKLQPENAEVWNNYGAYLAGRGRYEDAISAFETAHGLDPLYVTASANLAKRVWQHYGNVQRAKELYEEAVSVAEPSVPSWILTDFAIFCAEALSDYGQAADLHDRAAQDENFPLARAQQALFMLERKQDPSKAAALLASSLESQPNNPQILVVAARADFFYLGNREAAREKLHKACSLNPSDVYLLRWAADLCAMTGDSYSAAYYYRKAIKRHPHEAELHGNYGLALLMERKLEAAERHLKKAIRSSPNQFAFQVNLASTLWAAGKQAEAIALIRDLIDDGPPPEIELEVTAMSYLTTPSSRREAAPRIRQLIAGGVKADATTVRCMARDMSSDDRETAERLARAIEGNDSIPPEW